MVCGQPLQQIRLDKLKIPYVGILFHAVAILHLDFHFDCRWIIGRAARSIEKSVA